MIFMVFSIVGIFTLVGWAIVSSLTSGKKRRGAAPKPVVSGKGGGAEVVKDEWLSHLNKGGKKNKKRN